MIDWVLDNAAWLFSGAGLLALSWVGRIARTRYNRWRESQLPTQVNNLTFQVVRSRPFQSRLPGFLLRAIHKPETVRPRVKVDLRTNSPIALNLGTPLPSVDLYFQVTNLSPVDLILDRILADVWFGQPTFTAFVLHRYNVPAGEITEGIHVRQMLAGNQKDRIEEFKSAHMNGQLHIYITAYFESKLGRFSVQNKLHRDRL